MAAAVLTAVALGACTKKDSLFIEPGKPAPDKPAPDKPAADKPSKANPPPKS